VFFYGPRPSGAECSLSRFRRRELNPVGDNPFIATNRFHRQTLPWARHGIAGFGMALGDRLKA